jgi:hypothetical protein
MIDGYVALCAKGSGVYAESYASSQSSASWTGVSGVLYWHILESVSLENPLHVQWQQYLKGSFPYTDPL